MSTKIFPLHEEKKIISSNNILNIIVTSIIFVVVIAIFNLLKNFIHIRYLSSMTKENDKAIISKTIEFYSELTYVIVSVTSLIFILVFIHFYTNSN